ncbi:MAG: carbon-nitrogen hydrolase family protein, partial [Chitinispirillaceae bacterium]|nr:carbon-nitrogen hydrolase family protein [Chitinispirillaceae bacterium]
MRSFTIALCQITPDHDKAANVDRAFAMVSEAAGRGAELIILPEIFYYPFELQGLRRIAGDEEVILRRFKEHARRLGIHLCTGSMVEKRGKRHYNTSRLFGPDGAELLSYSKCHLFDADPDGIRVRESLVFTHGESFTVAQTPLGTIGILICYDIRFPEMARQAALLGVDVLLVPAVFNQVTGPAHWECFMRTRAVENQCFLAAAFQGRSSDQQASYQAYGHSMVISPWGDILSEAGEGECIVYATVDPERIRETK